MASMIFINSSLITCASDTVTTAPSPENATLERKRPNCRRKGRSTSGLNGNSHPQHGREEAVQVLPFY